MSRHLREVALGAFQAAVEAAQPGPAVRAVLAGEVAAGPRSVRVLSVGKAAVGMAEAAMASIPSGWLDGLPLVVTTHELAEQREEMLVVGSGHPVPDEAGIQAGRMVERFVSDSPVELLLVLISGGGSALLPAPVDPVGLEDLTSLTRALLATNADITEVNTVRKHLSRLKGGRLATVAGADRILALLVSDVVGDDPSVIAGGLTAPDVTTFEEAIEVLRLHRVWGRTPARVRQVLTEGAAGARPETPGPDAPVFGRVTNLVVASNRDAVRAAAARCRGHAVEVVDDPLVGDVSVVAGQLVDRASRGSFVAGGETTVNVTGRGAGGRNQELALRFAIGARATLPPGWVFLSGGTDGADGVTDAAGGLVDAGTVDRIVGGGGDPAELLAENDSGRALTLSGDRLVTGQTGTNVADVVVFLQDAAPG